MKKTYVRLDSRNRVCLTKLLKIPTTSFYGYVQGGKIILEPVIEVPNEEAWLFEPKNREALKRVVEGLKQEGTIDRGSFAKYVKKS